jgi:shikimate dehydrogenase
MKYGLIGEHLPHSFSKEIHAKIAPYEYELHEIAVEDLDDFMKKRDFNAINITIPYKQAVIPYLSYIDERAKKIGAVNTIVNREGKLYGYNTDFFGMQALIERAGITIKDKKVLILGTGGTSKTAKAVAEALLAKNIIVVGRKEKDDIVSYETAYAEHSDAEIIINTTPCGMYPNIDDSPVDLDCFPRLCGLVDAIYNPLRTVLVLEAQKRGIPAQGGLYMLVVQAVYAAELFTGKTIDDAVTEEVYMEILNSKRNIVLTGMSLAGKTTLGTLLSQKLDRRLEDTDDMIVNREQRPITDIFSSEGEPYFRDLETAMVRELAPQNGIIISTGGGAILREENVDALKKNGCVIFLDRPLEQILPADDRPLANTKEKVTALMEKRYPIYRSTCDDFIPNNISPEDGAAKILAVLQRA